jgi:hypothetical protein
LYQWTAVQIVEKFGIDKVTKKIQEQYKSAQSVTEKHDVVFCVYDRPGMSNKYPLAPELRPFGHKHFLLTSSEQLGDEGGYYDMPAFAPRWKKTNNSKWGHSPAMLALNDVLTLQQLVELILSAAEKAVDPVTLTTERGLLSDLNLGAGEISVVRSLDDIAPYESKARFDVSELQKEKLQDQVNRSFFVDQLQLKQSPAMTAAEVYARMELMQRLLGPTLARLQNDFLDPLIQRTFNIMHRAGQLPPMPENVKKSKGKMKVTYVSPLYRAQRADQVGAIQQYMVMVGSMSEIPGFQDIIDILNPDEIGREVGKMLGVPLKMINSEKETLKRRNERKSAIKQEQTLEAISTLGGATKDLAQARAAGQPVQ